MLAMVFYLLGVVGWFYIGGWMILTRPVKGLILAYEIGNLSIWKFVRAFIQGFFYLSLAGGVWCIGYILGNHFKE
jgi:hypothetical protein